MTLLLLANFSVQHDISPLITEQPLTIRLLDSSYVPGVVALQAGVGALSVA